MTFVSFNSYFHRLALSACLALLSFSHLVFSDQDNTLRIGLSPDRQFPPFSWADHCGQSKPLGVPLDIAGAALTQLGISYQWQVRAADIPPASLFASMGKDGLDATILPGNRENDSWIKVSEPVFMMRMSVFVRIESRQDLAELGDLADNKGLYLVGRASPGFIALKTAHATALAGLDFNGNFDQVVKQLKNGEVDYFITDRSVGSVFLVERGLTHEVVRSSADLNVNIPLYLYISTKSPYAARAADISKQLTRLIKTGEAAFLMRKNMLQWMALRHQGGCGGAY